MAEWKAFLGQLEGAPEIVVSDTDTTRAHSSLLGPPKGAKTAPPTMRAEVGLPPALASPHGRTDELSL